MPRPSSFYADNFYHPFREKCPFYRCSYEKKLDQFPSIQSENGPLSPIEGTHVIPFVKTLLKQGASRRDLDLKKHKLGHIHNG